MPSCAHRRADGLKGQTVNFFVYLCTNIKNKGMYIGLSCMCPDLRNRNNVVVRGKPLSGCRPDEGDSNENWSCGWVMFVDTNANNARDASEATLKETGELNGVTLIHRGGVSHASLVYNSMGYTNNTPGNFTARPRGNTDDERSSIRTLCIDRTARIRRIKGTGC